MNLYITHDWEGTVINVHGTLKDAHYDAKQHPGRETLQIRLYDVPIAKENLVKAFASALLPDHAWGQFVLPSEYLRSWCLTRRGGLHEQPQ